MANTTSNTPKSTRRQFAKTLAAIAASPLFARVCFAHGERQFDQPNISNELVGPQDNQLPAVPDAEALAQVARIRYGKYLTEDQIAEIRRSIEGRLRNASAMNKFKLANGDEPAFVFKA